MIIVTVPQGCHGIPPYPGRSGCCATEVRGGRAQAHAAGADGSNCLVLQPHLFHAWTASLPPFFCIRPHRIFLVSRWKVTVLVSVSSIQPHLVRPSGWLWRKGTGWWAPLKTILFFRGNVSHLQCWSPRPVGLFFQGWGGKPKPLTHKVSLLPVGKQQD